MSKRSPTLRASLPPMVMRARAMMKLVPRWRQIPQAHLPVLSENSIRLSGWPDRSPRRFPGHQLPPTWCGTTTACLWTCLHVPGEGDGHPRPTDLAAIAVAKSVCRASDCHRASRVPGPGAGLRRGTSSDKYFLLMRPTTMRSARIWRWAKTRL